VLEPGGVYFRKGLLIDNAEINAGNFGAKRPGNALHLDAAIGCHDLNPSIPQGRCAEEWQRWQRCAARVNA
jgi:hypothetical protein